MYIIFVVKFHTKKLMLLVSVLPWLFLARIWLLCICRYPITSCFTDYASFQKLEFDFINPVLFLPWLSLARIWLCISIRYPTTSCYYTSWIFTDYASWLATYIFFSWMNLWTGPEFSKRLKLYNHFLCWKPQVIQLKFGWVLPLLNLLNLQNLIVAFLFYYKRTWWTKMIPIIYSLIIRIGHKIFAIF